MEETFEFAKTEKVKTIPLALLVRSASLLDDCEKPPKTRPIEHYDLIQGVGDILISNKLQYEQEPIWVSKSGHHYLKSKDIKLPATHVGRRLFERLVTTLKITTDANDITSGAIAIGYNERGLQIAWGTNVNVCNNMSIFGNWFMATYSSNKMPSLDKIYEVLNNWASNFAVKRAYDKAILAEMMNIEMSYKDITNLIGTMETEAVNSAYVNKEETSPLSINQTSLFTQTWLKKKEEVNTLYDVYNVGTSILTPQKTDLSVIWDNNAMFSAFIVQMFNLHSRIDIKKNHPELLDYQKLLTQ